MEFTSGLAIILGAAEFARRGSNLFCMKDSSKALERIGVEFDIDSTSVCLYVIRYLYCDIKKSVPQSSVLTWWIAKGYGLGT